MRRTHQAVVASATILVTAAIAWAAHAGGTQRYNGNSGCSGTNTTYGVTVTTTTTAGQAPDVVNVSWVTNTGTTVTNGSSTNNPVSKDECFLIVALGGGVKLRIDLCDKTCQVWKDADGDSAIDANEKSTILPRVAG
jgi:hypothetical protein